jgi:hypothetical protein
MSVELIVPPGVDSAFIAWCAPFIDDSRGFALRPGHTQADDRMANS